MEFVPRSVGIDHGSLSRMMSTRRSNLISAYARRRKEFTLGPLLESTRFAEIRARAALSWDADRLSVELIFLRMENSLPPVPDDMDPSTPLETIADGDAQRLAERLDTETDPVVRNLLWQALVDGWARRAQPTGVLTDVIAAQPYRYPSSAGPKNSNALSLTSITPSPS
ncbi:MAG: hypothetical protein R2715_13275 [Ilumatobacteraceae bacterium]